MDRSGRRLSGPAIVISPGQGLLDPDPRDDLSVRIRSQSQLVITVLLHLLRRFPFRVGGHRQLALENLALRQQLAVYERTASQPELRNSDRLFWPGYPGCGKGTGIPSGSISRRVQACYAWRVTHDRAAALWGAAAMMTETGRP